MDEPRSHLDPRHFLFAGLAAGGCQCGDEVLVDASARLEVTPQALDFGEVTRGDLRVLGLDLSNTGESGLSITMKALAPAGGELAFASPVPEVLNAQATVRVSVVYQPADLGEDLGSITLAADDGQAPIVIALHGVGVEGGAAVEFAGDECEGLPGSLSFGRSTPGSVVERAITVRSQGGAAVAVLSAVVEPGSSPEWSISSETAPLPAALAPGEDLVLIARYAPVDGGADLGAFVITTDAPATPSFRIPACGVGVAPAICARPIPLDLGAAGDQESVAGRLTLESCGEEPLEITAVELAQDALHPSSSAFRLTQVPALTAVLQPREAVEVEVTFDGRMPFGPSEAWVLARSNALGSAAEAFFPILASTASPCALFVAPTDLYFRNVAAGQSMQRSVLVGNSGQTDCSITSLAVTTAGGGSEFALPSPPLTPFVLASGASQTIAVAYAPSTAGPHDGELAITGGGGTPRTVALHGNPPEAPGCLVDIVPSLLDFGLTPIGTTPHLAVRVEAIGEDPCRVTSAQLLNGNPVFTATLPLLRTAFPGIGGVSIDVAYAPLAPAASSEVLQIGYEQLGGGGTGMALVGVSGTAAEARICVTPPALDFGTVAQGSSSAQSVTISSCGAAELGLRGILLSTGSGGPFRITGSPSIPQALAAGVTAAPALTVTYAPADLGPHFGQVEILSTDNLTPALRVPLTGNFAGACDEVLQCAPSVIDFGDTAAGTRKLVRVVCRSLGNAAVTVSSVALSGAGPELTVIAQTPVTIQPGDAWTFDVRFAPAAPGPSSATLAVTSNACIAPGTFAVSGAGVDPLLPPCQPPSTFSPRVQWSWHTTSIEPTFTNVWSTPLVANLTDDNGDGRIDENDVAEVVFISLDTYMISDPGGSVAGVLRALSGDTGAELFSVTEPRFADTSIPAIGDLDGDGRPEIVGCKWIQTPPGTGAGGIFGRYITGTLVALDNTGRLLWESDPWSWPPEVSFNAAAPAIADLDGDGFAEVILGRDVFDHRGRLLWRGTSEHGLSAAGPHSIAADLDLDGHPEILAGGTVYRADGTVSWNAAGLGEGGTAVGVLDLLDPFPQIALHTGTSIVVLDHLGQEKWAGAIPSMGPATMLPVIADFDADGDGDIAVADGEGVQVFYGTGTIMWSAPVSDSTCCAGISAFDFEGDGAYELILTDYGTVYVYRGSDGTQIYSAPRESPTAFEMPVVADIDNDSKAELVVALFGGAGTGGIIAYSNVGDTWVAAPRIWNQQSFHVTNVEESGAIPRVETPITQGPNVFRGTSAACR